MHGRDITGEVFGRLTAIKPVRAESKSTVWLCRCACGVYCEVLRSNIVNKRANTRSCGCLAKELTGVAFRTHGESRTSPEYRTWCSMKRRCTNPSTKNFRHYGGRGITVCQRWMDSYEVFLSDMGRRPSPKHTLDRIDNNKGYSPDNCRWATYKEQALNKSTTRRINGKSVQELSLESGISVKCLQLRLHRGWSIERATTQPIRKPYQPGGAQC